MLYDSLSKIIVPTFYQVYRELGKGLLENCYRAAMQVALEEQGLACQSECPIDVHFRGRVVGHYRMDLVVEGAIVLECKVAKAIVAPHEAQLLNYLRVTQMRLGFILNFGDTPRFKRLIYDTARGPD